MTFIPTQDIGRMTRRQSIVRKTDRQRLPAWVKVRMKTGPTYQHMRTMMKELKLHTICEEARCPNVWECWNNGTATFLILGDICTRRCHYCSVDTGRPLALVPEEPITVARAVQALNLRHAVITSVNRDDLNDGGASVFAETIRQIACHLPGCTTEVLIPDFGGNPEALATLWDSRPTIVNHNIETVERLFPTLRPQGKYDRSLQCLRTVKKLGARTKSGLIIGMGETKEEIRLTLRDLRTVHCDMVTIGQYLQPTSTHLPVKKYYPPETFAELKAEALELGFSHVESGPLVRSSYHAEQQASTSNTTNITPSNNT